MRAPRVSAHRKLDGVGETAGDRPTKPLDDLRVQAPMPVEGLPGLTWWLVTFVVAYGSVVLLVSTGNFIMDPCDRVHESPNVAFRAAVAAGSILVSLIVGHRLLVRRQLIVVYAAAALQALVWYWLLVIPGGTC